MLFIVAIFLIFMSEHDVELIHCPSAMYWKSGLLSRYDYQGHIGNAPLTVTAEIPELQ